LATLNNKKIKDTFKGLLKTLDNAEITGQVEITDGDGNQTGVFINTDGSIKVTGTTEFGSLKDTGEDITITKFVDEADGIANNDNDNSIPTTAAVKDYVDSTELDTVTSVNTQIGDVVLDTDDISEGSTNLYYTEARADSRVDAQTGSNLDLSQKSTSDLSEGTNLYYTDARVSANTNVADNTLKNTYPSTDATKVGHITVTQSVDLDTLESNVDTNNAKISFDSTSSTKLAGIESGAEVNPTSTDELSEGSTNLYYTDSRVESNGAVSANTAKTGITTQQAADISTNNAKVGITTTQADAITANTAKISFDSASSTKLAGIETNADVTDVANVTTALNSIDIQELSNVSSTDPTNNQVLQFNDTTNKFEPTTLTSTAPVDSVNTQTGAVVLDTDDINEGTSNLYFTDARVSANSDVTDNTAKVGITTQQAADIQTNNAKVGITTTQADAITANTDKNSYPTSDATKLSGIEAGAEVNPTSTDGLSEGSTNLYYTEARVSTNINVAANTLKNSYPSTDATKVGFISVTQAVDLDTIENDVATNNTKVGITTQQAQDIAANNAKISFDSTSSAKLAGIEAGAEVNSVDSVNGQTGTVSLSTSNVSEGSNLYYTDARVTANSSVAANTAKITYPSSDSTKVGFITITQAVDLDSVENKQENQYKVIGVAMDYSNRVLSDSGTAEGTQSIMENIETLILN